MKKMKLLASSLYASAITASMQMAFATVGTASSQTLPSEVVNVVNNILGAVSAVGIVVAIGMIVYAGFKFLTAGAGEKAKAKDMLVPMIVGGALVALAGPIATWIWGMLSGGTAAT